MIEKWQALFEELELIESGFGSEIWSQDELQIFEANTGIILPDGYKEFCQIFGTSKLGNYISIYCPSIAFSQVFIEAIKLDINAIKDDFNSYSYLKLREKGDFKFEFIEELINSSFIFGDNVTSDVVLWDLRTFQDSDRSYDIYLANSDCFDGDIYQVGRDFYEFIYDFCLGLKSHQILPKPMRPAYHDIQYTFSRFKPS